MTAAGASSAAKRPKMFCGANWLIDRYRANLKLGGSGSFRHLIERLSRLGMLPKLELQIERFTVLDINSFAVRRRR